MATGAIVDISGGYDVADFFLRQLDKNDVTEEYVTWLNDHEINKYLELRHSLPISFDDVTAFVERCLEEHRPHWGIFYRNRHIGNISCSLVNLEYRWIDVSFLIGDKTLWGKGILTCALASVLDYLFQKQKFHRVQSGTYELNTGANSVFVNLGFLKEGYRKESAIVDNRFVNTVHYAILNSDWAKKTEEFRKIKIVALPWTFFGE